MEFQPKGSQSRKLTQAQVDEIRHWISKGATHGSLARHFQVSAGQIGRIARGESWAPTAGRPQDMSPANQDAFLQRARAQAQLMNESPTTLAMAKEFKAVLDEPREAQQEFVYPPPGFTHLQTETLKDLSPAETADSEAILARLVAGQQAKSSIEIPLSPLDGGDIPDVVEGAVDVLQDKARAQGVDIDKLLK